MYLVINKIDTTLFSDVIIEIDHGRSGGSYGNNILMICYPAGAPLELRFWDVPAPDNKSLGCCCCNTLLTAINPLIICPNEPDHDITGLNHVGTKEEKTKLWKTVRVKWKWVNIIWLLFVDNDVIMCFCFVLTKSLKYLQHSNPHMVFFIYTNAQVSLFLTSL